MAWVDRRAELGVARAWYATMRSVVSAPAHSLDGIPERGALGPSVAFAGIAMGLYALVGGGSSAALLWAQLADALARFGASARLDDMLLVALVRRVLPTILTPVLALVSLVPLTTLVARFFGRSVPLRAAAHAAAYVSAWLVLAAVPVAGWLALLAMPRAFHCWLARQASLSGASALAATAVSLALALVAGSTAASALAGVVDALAR